jgi:hypothetical protein
MNYVDEEQMDVMAFEMGQTRLRGSRFADKVEDVGRNIVGGLQAASQDQEGIGDDILRAGGKVLQGVGTVANLPGIKQGLQVLDAPFHYGSKLAGAAAERMGIDPRLGEWTVRAGELATGVGALKKAPKAAGRLATEATEFAFKNAPPGSVARMVYDTGGGMGPVPQHLTKIVKSGKDVATELAKSPNYKALNKKYKYIKPEEFANSPNLKKFLHREDVLKRGIDKVNSLEKVRDRISDIPQAERLKGVKRDPLKGAEKNLKTNRRTTLEHASLNLLDKDAKHVFFMNRNELKKSFKEFAGEGTEWHHLFGNKETGNLFLNEVAQDTMVAANLMEHMKKLKLQSSGVRKNLSIMKKDPHNELHTMYRKMGFEQGKELDFADYMQEIAKSVGKGETNVNEFFTMLEVYSSRTMPWLKKKTKSFGGTEMSELPIDSVVNKYQSTLQKQLEQLSK